LISKGKFATKRLLFDKKMITKTPQSIRLISQGRFVTKMSIFDKSLRPKPRTKKVLCLMK